jgi:hypothetical protein
MLEGMMLTYRKNLLLKLVSRHVFEMPTRIFGGLGPVGSVVVRGLLNPVSL